MDETTQYDLALPGCTPEPLMAYLKTLGILRLVSEQTDPSARGWWRNDVFWLRSTLDRDGLTRFFLEEYRPTPIVAPWSGGSGFFGKDNKKAVNALADSDDPRTATYADVIGRVRSILVDEDLGEKPKDDDKRSLLRRYRRELPDEYVAWLDAAIAIRQDGQSFTPTLGSGGNDGRLDFTQNFMQRIVTLGLHSGVADERSGQWLDQALTGALATLEGASVGQFAPGRAGGPNATQGVEGAAVDNPWDFVLMMEGTLLLAGAATRRLRPGAPGSSAFPFVVRAVAAGFDSPSDVENTRGELWLPLWPKPTSVPELTNLFGEGRADVGARPARNGVEFARAAAGLGVDRGITGFTRFGFLERSGRSYLATPLGKFETVERASVDLLRDVDRWLDVFRGIAGEKAPARFRSALNQIDTAVFAFCRHGGAAQFQHILIALGRAERALATTEGKVGAAPIPVRPVSGLSGDWISAANDGSAEFEIALALASVHDRSGKVGPLRANLEPVRETWKSATWADSGRSVAWRSGALSANLAAVLQRRLMDGSRQGCEHLPLEFRFAASPASVAAFLSEELDDDLIDALLWGLVLVDLSDAEPASRASPGEAVLPREYALLKLLFLPRPIGPRRSGERITWRYTPAGSSGGGDTGVVIRPEARVLPLLRAGRVGEACTIGARRLRASGLPTMPGAVHGRARDDTWRELDRRLADADAAYGTRLAGSLLIPVTSGGIHSLVDMVCRDSSATAESLLSQPEELSA
jgi:CRISPR-associated protein Csx17